jgi:hypothetical protein
MLIERKKGKEKKLGQKGKSNGSREKVETESPPN